MGKNCRLSGNKLELVFDFGKQPLGNGFLPKKEFKKEYFFDMKIGFCKKSKLLQLISQPHSKKMFHDNYPFFSSLSKNMKKHFENTGKKIYKKFNSTNFSIIELGSNDGIFLDYFRKNKINHLGIEPAKNVANISKSKKINTLNNFFNKKCTQTILKKFGKANIFYSANVMCHIPDIKNLSKNIKNILKPNGMLIFEDPYLGDIFKKCSYDQIYDEHVFFFSLHSVKNIFKSVGMTLVDVEKIDTHGGSMRYYVKNTTNAKVSKKVKSYLKKEKEIGITSLSGLKKLSSKINKSKKNLVSLLDKLLNKGKSIAGYAATSKSTTILNFCKIDEKYIKYISDTTPLKIGKFSPGMHIPIKSYNFSQKNNPDYYFLFAWNHIEEILKKEKKFIKNGGKFITHVPKIRII